MGIFDLIKQAFSDTYTDEKGYRRFKYNDKLEHRYVAEKKLGRKLKPGEVVHHKDRDKSNNSEQNLWVFKDQASHNKVHKADAKRHGKAASYKGFKKKKKDGFWKLF